VSDPARLYLATHHGVYVVSPDGKARQVSSTRDDFMGFTPHPTDATTLYSSGHPASGGNLGFMASTDRGVSWVKLSDGVGPPDGREQGQCQCDLRFVQGLAEEHGRRSHLAADRASAPGPHGPRSLGQGRKYALCRDRTGASPKRGRRPDLAPGHPSRAPATPVHVAPHGTVYAFLVGVASFARASRSSSGKPQAVALATTPCSILPPTPTTGRRFMP
jgi:hypothetical protein